MKNYCKVCINSEIFLKLYHSAIEYLWGYFLSWWCALHHLILSTPLWVNFIILSSYRFINAESQVRLQSLRLVRNIAKGKPGAWSWGLCSGALHINLHEEGAVFSSPFCQHPRHNADAARYVVANRTGNKFFVSTYIPFNHNHRMIKVG